MTTRSTSLPVVALVLAIACGDEGSDHHAGGGGRGIQGGSSMGGAGAGGGRTSRGGADASGEAGKAGQQTTGGEGGSPQGGQSTGGGAAGDPSGTGGTQCAPGDSSENPACHSNGGQLATGGTLGGAGGDEIHGGEATNGGESTDGGTASGAGGDGIGGSGGTAGRPNSCGESAGGTTGLPPGTCFTAHDCNGSACVGTDTGLICVPIADACSTDADCDITEHCDGYCRKAKAFGEPCSAGDRCADPNVFCDPKLQRCLGVYIPATCSADSDCPVGTSCSRAGGVDPSLICKGPPRAGEICTSLPCADGMCCGGTDIFSRCQAKKSCGVTGDPSTCSIFACPDGQHCDYTDSSRCADNLTEGSPCAPRAGLERAGGIPCAPGLYCGGDSTSGFFCRKSPIEGELCVGTPDAAAPGQPTCTDSYQHGCSPCALGHYCTAEKRCARYANLGESCTGRSCAPGARCSERFVDGRCSAPNGAGGTSGAGGSNGTGSGGAGGSSNACGPVLHFSSVPVEQAVRYATSIWGRDLAPADVAGTTGLALQDYGSGDLGGIECLTNLSFLDLTGSGYRDLSALARLPKLEQLSLHHTRVADLGPLATSSLKGLKSEGGVAFSLGPLVQNTNITNLAVQGPVDCQAEDGNIQALLARGAQLSVPCGTHCGGNWAGPDRAVAVSNGLRNACALLPSGSVKCWDSYAPQFASPQLVSELTDAIQVAVGSSACAVTADGRVACWLTSTSGSDTSFVNRATFKDGLSGVQSVAVASLSPVCALLEDQSVRCWGTNYFGGLGVGDRNVDSSDTPLLVTALPPTKAVSAGGSHACALTLGGDVYCWGDNGYHQVDPSTLTRVYAPVRAALPAPAELLATGEYHTCAWLTDHSVWCWGVYQLGIVTPSPTRVTGVCDLVALSAGNARTCGLLSDGRVQCWGRVYALTGGDSFDQNSKAPVLLSDIDSAVSMSAGGRGGCVVSDSGSLKCYGGYLAFAGDVPDCVPGFAPPP